MNHGFIKVCAATPKLIVADCEYNTEQILDCISRADDSQTEFIVFPELCITGYTCGDLFYQNVLLAAALQGLEKIVEGSKNTDMVICIGMPIAVGSKLFNCAVMIQKGKILGVIPKTNIPNYNEFYEKRWFISGSNIVEDSIELCKQKVLFSSKALFKANNYSNISIAVEIGEDASSNFSPVQYHTLAGATVIFNLSASTEIAGKSNKRKLLLSGLSSQTISSYIYACSGIYESTTDFVYSGNNLIYENGLKLAESKRFQSDNTLLYSIIDTESIILNRRKNSTFTQLKLPKSDKNYTIVNFDHPKRNYTFDRLVEPNPFIPSKATLRDSYCFEVFMLQSVGLAKRLQHTQSKKAVIGISGGLDSTLALLVCVKAFDRLGLDRTGIIGVTMPGFGTTDRTYNNAINLMKELGITVREISIVPATLQHFKDIGHDPSVHDITYENTQARERTQILMDVANQVNGLVIGTGDLSELALGWATYNGDHMSMYAVNAGVPKTLVRYLIEWAAKHEFTGKTHEILMDIWQTPVSPELLPPSSDGNIQQKTEEIVGPYELHDFYLYYMLYYGFSPSKILVLALAAFKGIYDYNTILKWMKVFYRRFFTQQFKRSCLPDGPKVTAVSLSPRGDWKMPSDASYNAWINEIELL